MLVFAQTFHIHIRMYTHRHRHTHRHLLLYKAKKPSVCLFGPSHDISVVSGSIETRLTQNES